MDEKYNKDDDDYSDDDDGDEYWLILVLSRQSRVCRDKTRLLSRQNMPFVATNVCL